MGRISGKCVGDCSVCELLMNGEVDMIPCVLDQLFQRQQRIEKRLNDIEPRITMVSGEEKTDSILG